MRRVRIIPTLLIQRGGLVKSVKFKNHKYVGDPINAVKIFNDKEVDELIILDISAAADRKSPNLSAIKEIASEAFMPVGYGGGITQISEIQNLILGGVEKVILNTAAFEKPSLIKQGATLVGSQSIVVSVDVKRNFWGKYKVHVRNGAQDTGKDPIDYAIEVVKAGAGELIVNSIDRDGTFSGYDDQLIKEISSKVEVPVVAIGGAATMDDFITAIHSGASAVSAGSMFVFQRPHRAVLITYPTQQELMDGFYNRLDLK